MIQKFAEINEHKALYIRIIEQPIFHLSMQQFFVENMEEFKKGIPHGNDTSVLFGLGYQEFCVLVAEIMPYWEKLKETGKMFESLSEVKTTTTEHNK